MSRKPKAVARRPKTKKPKTYEMVKIEPKTNADGKTVFNIPAGVYNFATQGSGEISYQVSLKEEHFK